MHHSHHRVSQFTSLVNSEPKFALSLREGLIEHQRLRPLDWREIAIPRTHRETVGLPHRWTDGKLKRKVQIAHHGSKNGNLSGVFLSKERDVRQCNVEELCNYGGYRAEVA